MRAAVEAGTGLSADPSIDIEILHLPGCGCHFIAVGDDNEGCDLPLVKILEQFQNILRIAPVEISCRLIGQQQSRGMHKSPGNRGALHFASAELVRKMRGAMADARQLHRPVGRFHCCSLGLALQLQGQRNIFSDRQCWQEIEKLKNDPDVLAPVSSPVGLAHRVERLFPHVDLAAGWHIEGPEQVQQSALPAAAFPGDRHERSLFNAQRRVT